MADVTRVKLSFSQKVKVGNWLRERAKNTDYRTTQRATLLTEIKAALGIDVTAFLLKTIAAANEIKLPNVLEAAGATSKNKARSRLHQLRRVVVQLCKDLGATPSEDLTWDDKQAVGTTD